MTGATIFKKDTSSPYLLLRRKEGRIYTDDEVIQLPAIIKKHPYYNEWLIRKRSCDHLIKYLKDKNAPLDILEVGCGNGWLSAKLSGISFTQVTGIDINTEELDQAKRVFSHVRNLEFLNGGIQNEVLNGRQFNVIVFAASIQYFSSLTDILHCALKRLKPNGEIHILDSHFYSSGGLKAARRRSIEYFNSIGFPEMIEHYFHRSLDELRQFNVKFLHDPHSIFNRFRKNNNPFYWIRITDNA